MILYNRNIDGREPVQLALGMLSADAQGSGKSFSCEGPGAFADNGNPFFTCKEELLLICTVVRKMRLLPYGTRLPIANSMAPLDETASQPASAPDCFQHTAPAAKSGHLCMHKKIQIPQLTCSGLPRWW